MRRLLAAINTSISIPRQRGELAVLLFFYRTPLFLRHITQGQMADHLRMSDTTTSRVLYWLKHDGFILCTAPDRKRPDMADFSLTPKGKLVAETLSQEAHRDLRSLLQTPYFRYIPPQAPSNISALCA